MSKIRTHIEGALRGAIAEQKPDQPIELRDDTVLLETGLDSLGFAILITRLESELGYDPFTLDDEAYYPATLGDFVGYYEKFAPSDAS